MDTKMSHHIEKHFMSKHQNTNLQSHFRSSYCPLFGSCQKVSRNPRTQESQSLDQNYLEHHGESLLKLCDYIDEIVQVSFLLTEGAEINNIQGCDKDWYLTS